MERTVEELKFENGVRRMLLLEDGIPIYYSTLYISRKHRNTSVSRQRSILYNIEVLLNWCRLEKINLEARFTSDVHLTESEIFRLLDFCMWSADTQKSLVNGARLLPKAYVQVSRKVAFQRIHSIREYLKFLYLCLAQGNDKEDVVFGVNYLGRSATTMMAG